MLTLDQALDRIAARFTPVGAIETVPLDVARGRALAGDVTAPVSVPPSDNSAVDGWAVRHQDLPGQLRIAPGRAAAGHPFDGTVGPGEALRIFTGAAMPDGADTVVMQEEARELDGTVDLPVLVRLGGNRRSAGEDMQAGDVVLRAGTRLGAAELGLLAALGMGRVATRARLRVAIFSNGDELTEPGAHAAEGQIYDFQPRHAARGVAWVRLQRRRSRHSAGPARRDRTVVAACGRQCRRDRQLGRHVGGGRGPCARRDRSARRARFLVARNQAGQADRDRTCRRHARVSACREIQSPHC